MAIEEIIELEDKVKIKFHLVNGCRIPDEFPEIEVKYEDVLSLPKPPELGGDNPWSETIYLKKLDKTISFHFDEWLETAYASMQGIRGGPFLVD
jgi:hypothetical protein